jgi:hypothetical protein
MASPQLMLLGKQTMFGIGTTELVAIIVIASIALRRTVRLPSSDLVEILNHGLRALFDIEHPNCDDSFSTSDDIVAGLLVFALITIAATCIVAMLLS